MEPTASKEVSLSVLLNILKKRWLAILSSAIVVGLLVGVAYSFVYTPSYSSVSGYYVSNVSSTTSLYSSGQTSAASDMAENYIDFLSGGKLLDLVREKGNLQLTNRQIAKMISARKSNNATFAVTISGPDAELNAHIAKTIELVYPLFCDYMNSQFNTSVQEEWTNFFNQVNSMNSDGKTGNLTSEEWNNLYRQAGIVNNQMNSSDGNAAWAELSAKIDHIASGGTVDSKSLKVYSFAQVDQSADNSSNRIKYPLIAAVIAAIVAALIFFLAEMFNSIIYSEENLHEYFGSIPVIGVIPHWTDDEDSTLNSNVNSR